MITIKATITPSNPGDKVRKIIDDLQDRREVMQQTKRYMIQRWNENFVSKGSIYGPWPGNSDWKEPGPTLSGNTGALIGYFFAANEAGEVSDSSVEWTFSNSGSQYSVTHSESGISPNPLKGHAPIPRRIMWDMNGTDRQHIVRLVETWIDSKVTF